MLQSLGSLNNNNNKIIYSVRKRMLALDKTFKTVPCKDEVKAYDLNDLSLIVMEAA